MTTTRRLQPLRSGTPVRQIRQPINRVIDQVNKMSTEPGGAQALPGFAGAQLLLLEIRTLNAANLTCNLPGQALNPSARLYTVELPQTFNESSRDGVNYVYSDINNRVADGTENQKLTPVYIINDLIVATVVGAGDFWIDINVDGRQWAKVP